MSDDDHLVDGKYGIRDLVDLDELTRIFERFTEATGFTIGFLDHPDLNVLIGTGWRDICTKFHRSCPASEQICIDSNRSLLDQLDEPGKLVVEECEHGLVDCAFPIIIKGKHIASLATGQMMLREPDIDRFKRQAERFGFDEAAYLKALDEIPVISHDKLRSATTFLGEMALVLTELGYSRLAAKEDALRLENEVATRRKAEQSLAEEREQLLVTLRSIGDGVITTDTSGRVVLMNKVAEELTGWSLAQGVGRPLSDVFNIVNEATGEPCENPVEKVLRSGQIVGLANHTVLVCRDGRERYIADSGAAIRDQHSDIIGVVMVFRDVTERKKSEAALQNAQKLQSLGVLAGGIAHDFNNYLGGIIGFVELAQDSVNAGDGAQAVDDLSRVSSVVQRARSLTQRLLTFARGEMPVLKTGSLADVVSEIGSFSTAGSDAALEFNASPDVPACSFDANQIAQVIQNLVLNAEQAMPRGGTIRVSVEGAVVGDFHAGLPAGSYVKISVHNDGEPIPAEILPHIFDPFFTTKPAGNGLGLAICYSIVKKHRGYMEATSSAAKGTEFTLYFPAVDHADPIPRQPEAARPHKGHGAALVMDDDEFIRIAVSTMLQRMGYDAVAVKDGHEALKALAERPIQLALLDVTIPGGMGGIETVSEIRKRYARKVLVFAMSGYSVGEVLSDPTTHGFDDGIAKPFAMTELASLLNSFEPPPE